MAKKILVIDDEPEIVDMLENRLVHAGYEVFKAKDGIEGKEKINSSMPDLIILDIMMPRLDGYSFLRDINQTEGMPKPPVIILTARDDFQLLMEIEGVKDYIMKPYDPKELLQKIEDILNAYGKN